MVVQALSPYDSTEAGRPARTNRSRDVPPVRMDRRKEAQKAQRQAGGDCLEGQATVLRVKGALRFCETNRPHSNTHVTV